MSWLARLKHGKHPDNHATKPTKPTQEPQNRGFVGFVASLPECFQKTAVSTDAANDPAPDPGKPKPERRLVTLAPDPGVIHLLAMAMEFCDRTGASDKARAQWLQDAVGTPPELRGDLYQYLLEQLPPAPALVPPARPAPAPSPHRWLDMDQAWRTSDAEYHTHHWQCPTCRAAAAGHAEQCVDGKRLHSEYTQAATAAMNGTNT